MKRNAFTAGVLGSLTVIDGILLFTASSPILFLVGLLVVCGGGLLTVHFLEEAGL